MYSLSRSFVGPGQRALDRDERPTRVTLEGDEEQPGRQLSQPVGAVHGVVATPQQLGTSLAVGCASRTCAIGPISAAPVVLSVAPKSGSAASSPPDIGPPIPLARPMMRSWPSSGSRSQVSIRIAILRVTMYEPPSHPRGAVTGLRPHERIDGVSVLALDVGGPVLESEEVARGDLRGRRRRGTPEPELGSSGPMLFRTRCVRGCGSRARRPEGRWHKAWTTVCPHHWSRRRGCAR